MDKDKYAKQLAEEGLTPEQIAKIVAEADKLFNELLGEEGQKNAQADRDVR